MDERMQDSILSRSIDIMSGSVDIVGATTGESSSDSRMEIGGSGTSVVLQGEQCPGIDLMISLSQRWLFARMFKYTLWHTLKNQKSV